MFAHLALKRPLAVFDLETTGKDATTDRIVEISVLKIFPDHSHDQRTRRLNPGIPIPEAATAVHGITDADVADKPTFKEVAPRLLKFLAGCDLCGYNLLKYDLPLLRCEFLRVGLEFPMVGRALLDPLVIFRHYERRGLSEALRFYCGREHTNAHGAEADVLATAAVLDAMVARYEDLPCQVDDLDQHLQVIGPRSVDLMGKFVLKDGRVCVNFGRKHVGRALDEVARDAPDYLRWMLEQDFPEDAKEIARQALDNAGIAETCDS